MKYNRISNEELSKYKHPNLIAEIIETGYSICTVAEYMGLGRYRKEDDEETLNLITGKTEISVSQALGLCNLFAINPDYLFSDDLATQNGKPKAYYRHLKENQRRDKELRDYQGREKIGRILKEYPELTDPVNEYLLKLLHETEGTECQTF